MGIFRTTVEIGDPTGSRWTPLQVLVDTGASHTVMPAAILEQLGVRPHATATFRLADGRRVERDIGRTWIRVDGHEEITQVVFEAERTDGLLGVITLEEMRLGVDPISRRFVPIEGLMM
ncbi:MAG: retroviral-like aspartic protease family protein [Chloroflexi bacterium]|nr:retroviral-like aspartic protease family protein [Chloroflexota bacterium]